MSIRVKGNSIQVWGQISNHDGDPVVTLSPTTEQLDEFAEHLELVREGVCDLHSTVIGDHRLRLVRDTGYPAEVDIVIDKTHESIWSSGPMSNSDLTELAGLIRSGMKS